MDISGVSVLSVGLVVIAGIHYAAIIYLIACKWFLYPLLLIPAVYYSSLLISRKDAQLEEISRFRSICVFVGILNEFFNVPLLSFKIMMIVTTSFEFTICLIYKVRFVSTAILTLSLIMLVVANLSFSFAKVVFESSHDFVHNMKTRAAETKGKILIRTPSSLRESKIFSCSLYYIDQGAVMKISDIVFRNTISNVIMFKDIWHIILIILTQMKPNLLKLIYNSNVMV